MNSDIMVYVYYLAIFVLVGGFTYLCIRALQAIIGIEKTMRNILTFIENLERKKEEREMRRI